jgi:hypothetical protein
MLHVRRTWGPAILALGQALLLAGGCATASVSDRAPQGQRELVIQQILPPTVHVLIERQGQRFRSGSGVIVAARPGPRGTDCFLLTSGHTMTNLPVGTDIHVVLDRHRGEGVKMSAALIVHRYTDDLDLALLKATSDHCPVARLGTAPGLGDAIWVVAFPWGRNMTLVGGIISQVDREDRTDSPERPRLMVDASVSYGASGGGVYDAPTGRLVGLIEGYRKAHVSFQVNNQPGSIEVPVPGETYVISLSQIKRFLAETGYSGLVAPVQASAPGRP